MRNETARNVLFFGQYLLYKLRHPWGWKQNVFHLRWFANSRHELLYSKQSDTRKFNRQYATDARNTEPYSL